MTGSSISPQEPTKPLHSDDQMPLYVLSIQERAEQLAAQFEGKPVRPQVTLLLWSCVFGELASLFFLFFLGIVSKMTHVLLASSMHSESAECS